MTSWFHWKRIPEPEVMDSGDEVEAYASAAAQKYLARIDGTFIEHLGNLLPARLRNGFQLLDVGCGPGQIPIRIKKRWPTMQVTAIDAAPTMIEQARKNAAAEEVEVTFEVLKIQPGGKGRLPYADQTFDLLTCNSVVHHLPDPVAAFDEMGRVLKTNGGILIRDLRRPNALAAGLHMAWFGRHYRGEMRRLYRDSVRAAYTEAEMREMLSQSRLRDSHARVFLHGMTHLGIERAVTAQQTGSAGSV